VDVSGQPGSPPVLSGEVIEANDPRRLIADDEKPSILRAYLKRWKAEVGVFFDGVSAKSSDEDLRRIAPNHPIFCIESTGEVS